MIQFNKRDLPSAVSVNEMNQALNPKGVPFFEASAPNGQGVFETLKEIAKKVIMQIKQGT